MTGILNKLFSGLSAVGRAYGSLGSYFHPNPMSRIYASGSMYCCEEAAGLENADKTREDLVADETERKDLGTKVKEQSNIS